jgi:hypothetical protein
VLLAKARGLERAATAVRSPVRMSVQPDITICVSALPPSSEEGAFSLMQRVKPLHVAFL